MAEVVPNNEKEEVPVYIVRSSIPTGGPKGQISFEFREENNQRELGGLGEIFQDTYNTEEFSLPTVGENSTNFDYRGMADSILQTMNNNIKELSEGVEKLGVLSIVETQTEPPQNFYNYTIIGKVIDAESLEPLGNVFITDDVKSVGLMGSNINSEPTGNFVLMGEYQKDKTFKLTFSLQNYITKTVNPFTRTDEGDLILSKDINIIKLSSTLSNKQTITEEIPYTDSQLATIIEAEKLKDPQGFFTDEFLQKIVRTIKLTLLPFALNEIAKFGITNAKEALDKNIEDLNISCPTNLEQLNEIINIKNKLTKQLNNLFDSLDTIKVGVEAADQFITAADIAFQTLSSLVLAFPSIPFAPDITKLFTTKIPPLKNKTVQEIIDITLTSLKIISSSTLLILNILMQLIQQILNYLALLDGLIQKCAIDGALPQESLSLDLLAATTEQSNQGSPVVTNVNGFEMGVIDVEDGEKNQLKRRQATARNKDGVIMLRGEASFSSNDQILIDELVFYIKQNDLKAD